MFSRTRQKSRPMLVLLTLALSVGMTFSGCGQAAQTDKKQPKEATGTKAPAVSVTPVKPATKETVPAAKPAPEPPKPAEAAAPAAAPAPAAAVPAKADAPKVGDEDKAKQLVGAQLVDLYASLQQASGGGAGAAKGELEKQWSALIEKAGPPLKMCDEVDLVAGSLRSYKGAKPRTLSLLFRVNQPMKKDYPVMVEACFDASMAKLVPESDRSRCYSEWSFNPNPPTSAWKQKALEIGGQSYILFTREPDIRNVPYRVKVNLSTGAEGKWAMVGKAVSLPWMAVDY